MPSSGLLWIEYPTADGIRITIQVPPDVATALAEQDREPQEIVFTDLAGKLWHPDERRGLDPNGLEESIGRRRIAQRKEYKGNPWEGPRFRFSLLLGEGRPGWLGGETVDDRGRCGLCHDLWLPPYACCLACCRTGRDASIPTPGEQVRRRAPKPSRSRSGRRLAGGVGR